MNELFVLVSDGGALADHVGQLAGLLHGDSGFQRHLYQLQPSIWPVLDHAGANERPGLLPGLHFNHRGGAAAKVMPYI